MNIFSSKWSYSIGEIVYDDKSQLGRRRQLDLQLVYLYEGDLSITVDGHCYALAPGEVTLLLPGGMELFHFATHSVTRQGWCRAHCSTFNDALLKRLSGRPERLELSDSMRLLIDMALPLRDAENTDMAAYRDSLIQAIYSEFLSRCSFQEANEERQPLHPAVVQAKGWIEGELSQPVHLSDIAQVAGVSPAHLTRLFQQAYGISPIRYLWEQRLKNAAELLYNTGLSVAEISYRSGFSNPQHFSKMFKAHYRMTPGSYRVDVWKVRNS
jgi:AraC family transcriptional regulator of arabinose operon